MGFSTSVIQATEYSYKRQRAKNEIIVKWEYERTAQGQNTLKVKCGCGESVLSSYPFPNPLLTACCIFREA